MAKRIDTRYRVQSVEVDGATRWYVEDTLTDKPADQVGSTSAKAYAKNWAADYNRQWREARSRARGVLLGVLAEDEVTAEGLGADTLAAVLDALTAAPEIVDAFKEIR